MIDRLILRMRIIGPILGLLMSLPVGLRPLTAQEFRPSAQANSPSSRPTSTTIVMADQRDAAMIVGVMGAVATPGIYQFDSRHVTIRDLIEKAGQPTQTAAGTVRVLRGSYVNMKLFMPSQEEFPLEPADMIVVESQSQPQHRVIDFSRLNEVSTESKQHQPPAETIQIGLVNLLDYPMLMTLKSVDADLQTLLVNLLNQAPAAAYNLKVIEPVAKPQNQTPGLDRPLLDGTVLVFDPRLVDRERLPVFPAPFKVKTVAQFNPPDGIAAQMSSHQSVIPSTDETYLPMPEMHSPAPLIAPQNAEPQFEYSAEEAARTQQARDRIVEAYLSTQHQQAGSETNSSAQAYVRQRLPGQLPTITPSQSPIHRNAVHSGSNSPVQLTHLQSGNSEQAANVPIDLSGVIEQQQPVSNVEHWHQPQPDPRFMSHADSTSVATSPSTLSRSHTSQPQQPSPGDISSENRIAQLDPFDDIQADFPRKQFLQFAPQTEPEVPLPQEISDAFPSDDARMERVTSEMASHKHATAESSVSQLVPLPTEDPYDIHLAAIESRTTQKWKIAGSILCGIVCAGGAYAGYVYQKRRGQQRSSIIPQRASSHLQKSPQQGSQSTSTMMSSTFDQLQALIEDLLPIEEQEVVLQSGQHLFGHPTISKYLRVDTAHLDPVSGDHELTGPHFARKPKITTQPEKTTEHSRADSSPAQETSSLQVEMDGKVFRTDTAQPTPSPTRSPSTTPHEQQRDLMDRVTSMINREKRHEHRS